MEHASQHSPLSKVILSRPVESEAGYDPGDNWDRVSKQGTAGADALRRDCTWRD